MDVDPASRASVPYCDLSSQFGTSHLSSLNLGSTATSQLRNAAHACRTESLGALQTCPLSHMSLDRPCDFTDVRGRIGEGVFREEDRTVNPISQMSIILLANGRHGSEC